jgi:histidine kinase
MERLLDDLLDISRLELGNIELHTEPININAMLSDCAEELKFTLEKKGIDFSYTNPNATQEAIVMLDTDRFSRVITNIISNSIKYAKKDVKLKIEMSIQSYEKSVIISISDNGIGIDSENLPRIFESFYRADRARSKTRDGSGLGLSVCRQIVELHGGRIWATSKEGEGTTILISMEKI